MNPDQATDLVEVARRAREKAYAPYSNYLVGAALLGTDGKVYGGCNVENSSYGATLCAERVALVRAVADGCREFTALAVVTGSKTPAPPCGLCLQVLVEFARDLPVHLAGPSGGHRTVRLSELLPARFDKESLE